ncbi:MAG: hypothetical protein ACJA2W_003401 [Planctomycetota bacterium]|jgi:hypothetical protein
MGKTFTSITDEMRAFVDQQHLFFVGTAPREGGHVNLSPKGLDSLIILSSTQVAYLDLTGSGAETIAHVRENGRLTMMFCAFEGLPNIVRFYGQARVVLPSDPDFAELQTNFPQHGAVRSIIVLDVDRTSTSCGYGVPMMNYVKDRPTLDQWAAARSSDEVRAYWEEKNAVSIDGLPAVDP